MISQNLKYLRKIHNYSQEEVAAKLNVSRQAIAKWENGDTMPDLENTVALARLYNVTVDNLITYDDNKSNHNMPIPPKGRHTFGTVTVGERGQIVIPKKAREIFEIVPGDKLIILGDEALGLAILREKDFLIMQKEFLKELK